MHGNACMHGPGWTAGLPAGAGGLGPCQACVRALGCARVHALGRVQPVAEQPAAPSSEHPAGTQRAPIACDAQRIPDIAPGIIPGITIDAVLQHTPLPVHPACTHCTQSWSAHSQACSRHDERPQPAPSLNLPPTPLLQPLLTPQSTHTPAPTRRCHLDGGHPAGGRERGPARSVGGGHC
jgi:hypothetical protein